MKLKNIAENINLNYNKMQIDVLERCDTYFSLKSIISE